MFSRLIDSFTCKKETIVDDSKAKLSSENREKIALITCLAIAGICLAISALYLIGNQYGLSQLSAIGSTGASVAAAAGGMLLIATLAVMVFLKKRQINSLKEQTPQPLSSPPPEDSSFLQKKVTELSTTTLELAVKNERLKKNLNELEIVLKQKNQIIESIWETAPITHLKDIVIQKVADIDKKATVLGKIGNLFTLNRSFITENLKKFDEENDPIKKKALLKLLFDNCDMATECLNRSI